MFCFQCEQTALGRGCTGKAGVCGKAAEIAEKQDALTGALIALAKTAQGCDRGKRTEADALIREGLFATVTNVNFDGDELDNRIDKIHAAKDRIDKTTISDCAMEHIWTSGEDVRSLTSLILFGLRGMAAYACHAAALGYTDIEVDAFFCKALSMLGSETDLNILLETALETGRINLKCMELLERANTETYGNPSPVRVSMKVEKGSFIVVTGHDLRDLSMLLEQTQDTGVNIYTHGEMLPAHGYPGLRKYPHLKGNFGTAWQNQQREFDRLPGAILFTTNCLMPPKESYRDRVFTTGPVLFPNTTHIGADRDFSPVITRAKELGGWKSDRQFTGINGGESVMTGYGRGTILANAEKIVEGVKNGTIRHIFLVGGCDGAKPGRSYYSEFVKMTPKDTLILTLACGKYRFNDLDPGEIAGLPRILDMGQCNDAYGAIEVAAALARAFSQSINDLPLSMVLSWYEQKAVCILLTQLYLGFQNILLGPTLPAFISPNVLQILTDRYGIAAITDPETDMNKILNREKKG